MVIYRKGLNGFKLFGDYADVYFSYVCCGFANKGIIKKLVLFRC